MTSKAGISAVVHQFLHVGLQTIGMSLSSHCSVVNFCIGIRATELVQHTFKHRVRANTVGFCLIVNNDAMTQCDHHLG